MRIGLVVQDGCFASGVSSLLDILGTAESARSAIDASIPPLDVVVAGLRGRVRTSNGMMVTATRGLSELGELDVVVVPAVHTSSGADTEAAIESPAGQRIIQALKRLDVDSVRVAAACTGVFLLAEAGLLKARRVTTTWFLTPTFRARYPETLVDLDAMVVADGPVLTAGAAFAHIDLALAIVRTVSVELAQSVARLLLIDERPSQAAFVALGHLHHDDPIVLAFERHVRSNLGEPFDISAAAQAIGASRRTLERRTQRVLGLSPSEIVRRLRLERAQHLRRTTDLTTQAIAHRVGYANAETLRSLERRAR